MLGTEQSPESKFQASLLEETEVQRPFELKLEIKLWPAA